MPELAFGYVVGFAATTLLVLLHVFLQMQKQKSKAMRQLQANLKKIELFWSDSESDLKPYTETAEKEDLNQSLKSILISGVGCIFLSWVGFLMELILMLSVRFLAVKRIERNLFSSRLVESDMDAEAVKKEMSFLISI